MFLPGLFASSGQVNPGAWSSPSYMLAVLLVSVPQILLVVYVSDLRTPGFSGRMGWSRPRMSDVTSAFISMVAILAAVGIWRAIASVMTQELTPAVPWEAPPNRLLPIVVVASLAVAYREEVFFRAYLLERREELGLPAWAMVTASSVIFAVAHLYQGVAGFVVSLLIGGALGLVFLWRRSLHGVAIAHALYNVMVLYVAQI